MQHLVHAADTDCHAQQIAHELYHPAIGTTADQRQPEHHLAQPGPGDGQLKQYLLIALRRRERVIEPFVRLAHLRVDELATHTEPHRQFTDRFRSRQRLNGQFLALTPRQLRCRASRSTHARTTT